VLAVTAGASIFDQGDQGEACVATVRRFEMAIGGRC